MNNKLDYGLEVTSVTEFLDYIIRGTEKEQETFNLYYRGEAAVFPYRTPNLYLNDKLVREGSEYYYRSLLNELGRTDYKDSSSLFQLLSELQHYEAKTRMLDITSNPLVALYFATETISKDSADNLDGNVYLFKEEKGKEKFDTGHTVAIKSALNLVPQEKINTFLMTITKIIANLGDRDDLRQYENGRPRYFLYESTDELISDVESWSDFIENDRSLGWMFLGSPICGILNEEEYKAFCEALEVAKDEDKIFRETLNRILEEFLELLNQRAKINEKLKYPVRIYADLCDSHIVLSSKRTDRLRQQQGAFIYPCFTSTVEAYSLDQIKSKIHDSIMEKSTTINYQGNEYTHIIIPKVSKGVIRKELALIGIDEGFIFPDIKHRSSALLK
ncbi:FRG domain-containing protein [Streptococcus minor]|uniref:FRG domain-containing protein n=1 Tax=Streptococcus minor TaxID=229549 RepID=A0A3P1VF56_9STRE|nr:FRG domain-containing protein [Streptococcus minor]RRD31083.1 FRG domain-containing protein [Streptococcus minor]